LDTCDYAGSGSGHVRNKTTDQKNADLMDGNNIFDATELIKPCKNGCGSTVVPAAGTDGGVRPFSKSNREIRTPFSFEVCRAIRLYYVSLSPVERRDFVKTAMDGSTDPQSVHLHTPNFGVAVCAFGNDSCLAALLHVRTQSVRASSLVIRLIYV
jgi:hypothetical protein